MTSGPGIQGGEGNHRLSSRRASAFAFVGWKLYKACDQELEPRPQRSRSQSLVSGDLESGHNHVSVHRRLIKDLVRPARIPRFQLCEQKLLF